MPDQPKSKKQDAGSANSATASQVTPPVNADKFEDAPSLTPELLASYRDSQYRLLLLLGLVLAFVLACFPISDPDIFFSLEVGKMVSSGEFPWGTDPFGFADGDQAPWAHTGWLGDLTIYSLYQAGGGPLLVFVRALLLVFLFWLLLQTGEQKSPHLWTVLVVLLGIITISHRVYFRTELFSFVLLGITIWALARPATGGWFSRLHQLTAGRWYWLLPILFLLWVNFDSWFFLGLGVVVLWCAGCWLTSKEGQPGQLRALTVITLLCVAACFMNPFHVKAFTQIPSLLMSPTAAELDARYTEQKQSNPEYRMTEHQRLFSTPWSKEFLKVQRSDAIAGLSSQAPLLTLCYPMGISLSEWAYYPLMIAVLVSLVAVRRSRLFGAALVLLLFAVLSVWQSRFIGFFAVGGVAMALLLFQSRSLVLPSLNRLAILGGQLLCLGIGLVVQIISLLHLIPTPDYSPSSLGHIHPRGSFGFSFRHDAAIEEASEQVNRWRTMNLLAGKPYHIDWVEVVAYDAWFNPGGRHFFDTRLAVHSAEATQAYFAARDAIMGVITDPIKPDGSNLNKALERQAVWQGIFRKYDISYLIVKRRGQQQGELVRNLLVERDKNQQPLWKPLRLHNGQVYALAWVGSPHWEKIKKLEFNPGESVFREQRQALSLKNKPFARESLSKFLLADPPRRPAAFDESDWYLFQNNFDNLVIDANLQRILFKWDQIGNDQLRAMAASIAARLAAPMNTLPVIPQWFSRRQSSASLLYLRLEAARRGVAQLDPEAHAAHRFEAWKTYSEAVKAIADYEQSYTSTALAYREPQMNFVLRQAAAAAMDASHLSDLARDSAIEWNLQLSHTYVNNGALDAALEQYLLVRSLIERQFPDRAESYLKNLDGFFKKQFNFTPADLQNEVKRRMETWQAQVVQFGWVPQENEPAKNAIGRANLALQGGLPRKAIEELLASGVKTVEASLLAIQIYTILGQFDVVWQELVLRSPEVQARLQPAELHQLGALGEWSLGRPSLAAQHRLALSKLADENASSRALYGGQFLLLGTGTRGSSNVFEGDSLVQHAMQMSYDIAGEKVAAGLLHLEAGQPEQASRLFYEAIHNIEPRSPWRPLIDRYYLQITGEVLK